MAKIFVMLLIFLLVESKILSVQCQSATTVATPKSQTPIIVPVEPNHVAPNWLALSNQNWPTNPENVSNSFGERFHYCRGNYSDYEFVRLKRDFFNRIQTESNSFLNFQYWSDSDDTHFRPSSDHSKQIRLNQVKAWKSIPEMEIPPSELKEYQFMNPEKFLFALRNVNVKYTRKPAYDDLTTYLRAPYNDEFSNIAKLASSTENNQSFVVSPTTEDRYMKLHKDFIDNDDWYNSEYSTNKNCFDLTKNSTDVSLEVYFTFAYADRGGKLFGMSKTRQTRSFCLDQFVYLNRMDRYQLTVLLHGNTNDKVLLSLNQTSGHSSVVHYPTGEESKVALTSGWFFYNSLFDYSFDGPLDEDALGPFYACDIANNCFEYYQRVDQVKQRVVYSLWEGYRKILLNSTIGTPVIRIYSAAIDEQANSEVLLAKYNFNYNKGNSESLSKIKSLYPGSVVLDSAESFYYTRKVSQTTASIPLTIPLESIDIRIQEVQVRVTVQSAGASRLKLSEIKFNENGPTNWTWDQINLDSGKEFTISSREFFALGLIKPATNLPTGNLAITLELDNAEKQEIEYQVEFKLHKITDNVKSGASFAKVNVFQNQFNTTYVSAMFSNLIKFTESSSQLLLISDWTATSHKNLDTGFQMQFMKMKSIEPIEAKDIVVNRLVIDSNGQLILRDSPKLRLDNEFVADIDSEVIKDLDKLNHFKMFYLIKLANITMLEFQQLYSPFEKDSASCYHMPTFSPTSCDHERFQCLGNANYYNYRCGYHSILNEKVKCNADCSNIFENALASSHFYVPTDGSRVYAQTGTAENQEAALKISIPATAQKAVDYCVLFDYYVSSGNLSVTNDGNATNALSFNSVADWHRDATVCLSHFKTKSLGVFEFMFDLSGSERGLWEIGKNLIANIRVRY